VTSGSSVGYPDTPTRKLNTTSNIHNTNPFSTIVMVSVSLSNVVNREFNPNSGKYNHRNCISAMHAALRNKILVGS
jgi:hypothetical protein